MKLEMKMLPVKILASLCLVGFGAINCKPSTTENSVDEQSALNYLENQDSAANDEGASFALADQAQPPCPNPAAKPAPTATY